MGNTDHEAALAAIRSTSIPIHDMGTAMYLSPDVMGWAAEWGWSNPFAFYFAGRGGVLGEVDADVVYAAFGWFAPTIVRPMWETGVAVHGAREAARRYFAAAADWGRDHLAGCEGLERFNELAERLLRAADCSGRTLFAGWRVEPLVDDAPGRALQLVHVMREWRGSNHLVATTASGLTPLEAILAGDGEGQPKFFGWAEPFPAINEDHRARRAEAENLTDRLCAASYEVLSGSERADLAGLVPVLEAAAGG